LVDTLESAEPFTMFAPNNDAFAALPEVVLAKLLEPENKAELVKILTYHVVAGKVLAGSNKDRQLIKTVGEQIEARVIDGKVFLQDRLFERDDLYEVIQADVEASTGVVHVINKVILPK
jgi:uncharacterized surface protein with fasciclin (FAS1) repeats